MPIPWMKRFLSYAPAWFIQAIGKNPKSFKQYGLLSNYYKETPEYLPRMLGLLQRFDVILTISPVMGRILREFGVAEEKIHFALQGADFPVPLVAKTSDKLRLIFLGHIAPIKGFQVIVEAVSRLPDGLKLEIRIYVSDPHRCMQQLPIAARRYIKASKTLLGAEVEAELAGADALIIPSLWRENTPYAVLRALAASRPVIGSNHEGISHLITQGQNGFLLPPGDVEAWKTILHKLALDPNVLREMRSQCHYQNSVKAYADEVERL
jgi:glycosyltransferase involved in cell wall biosynthesis